MENASKALIIAGAILLSILLIGLGMYVYTQASGIMNRTNMDATEINAYNSQFEAYEGTQSGSQVRALLQLVRSHNNANVDDSSLNVNVLESSAASVTKAPDAAIATTVVNGIMGNIKAGSTYTVDFGYDSNSGRIVAVGITIKTN